MKNIYIIAKFGKGRKSRLEKYRFKTRKSAVLFGKIFLGHNPWCKRYTVYGE